MTGLISIALTNIGVRRGDIVALGFEPLITYIPICLGVILTGASFTGFRIETGRADLKHKLTVVNPTYILCSNLFWKNHKELLLENTKEVKNILMLDSLKLTHNDVQDFEPVDVKGQEDTALIYYSSGTTGLSKGIQLTHLNCIIHTIPDKYKIYTTAFHTGLWNANYTDFKTFRLLCAGGKVVYTEGGDIENALNTIEKLQVDIAFFTPRSLFEMIALGKQLKKQINSLKVIYSRSFGLHETVFKNLQELLPNYTKVFQGYGITECGELTSDIFAVNGPKPGSVGMPTPGIALKVVDLNSGKSLPPRENGEICVKGPAFMKGYIGTQVEDFLDNEGFFKTGDLGYYDEDGYFYIIDRIKETIKYSGHTIAPLELETLLLNHPGIKDAAVVGKPEPTSGELPTAFVVKHSGSTVSKDDLLKYIEKEVSPYMQLSGGVFFIEEIPRNLRGKILRQQLKKLLST